MSSFKRDIGDDKMEHKTEEIYSDTNDKSVNSKVKKRKSESQELTHKRTLGGSSIAN